MKKPWRAESAGRIRLDFRVKWLSIGHVMRAEEEYAAWLVTADGDRVPLRGGCSLGRSRANQVVLADERVSRKHALIHLQGKGQFYLVDLGTVNGTRVNQARVFAPRLLEDGDEIDVAGVLLVFRQNRRARGAGVESDTAVTIREIRRFPCWFLVVDIVGSTHYHQRLRPEEVAVLFGRWFAGVKEAIESNEGMINLFTGDGVRAVWSEPPERTVCVRAALVALRRMQQEEHPAFRILLHLGEASTSGTIAPGQESLLGSDVRFADEMEALAKGLRATGMVSEAALRRLACETEMRDLGCHALKSFEGSFRFFGF
jgi:class 3 adenylate cyclase